MTPEQFTSLCQILRIRDSLSRQAASLVLVDGLTQAAAARQTGLSPAGVGNVIARFGSGLALAATALGVKSGVGARAFTKYRVNT